MKFSLQTAKMHNNSHMLSFKPNHSYLIIAGIIGLMAVLLHRECSAKPQADKRYHISVGSGYLRTYPYTNYTGELPGINGKRSHAMNFTMGVGYRITDKTTLELSTEYFQYAFRGVDWTKEGNQTEVLSGRVTSIMLNAYQDLPSLGALAPYLMIGAGAAFHNNHGIRHGGRHTNSQYSLEIEHTGLIHGLSNTSFALAFGVGVRLPVTDNINLSLCFRHVNLGKFATKNQSYQTLVARNKDGKTLPSVSSETQLTGPLGQLLRYNAISMHLTYEF